MWKYTSKRLARQARRGMLPASPAWRMKLQARPGISALLGPAPRPVALNGAAAAVTIRTSAVLSSCSARRAQNPALHWINGRMIGPVSPAPRDTVADVLED